MVKWLRSMRRSLPVQPCQHALYWFGNASFRLCVLPTLYRGRTLPDWLAEQPRSAHNNHLLATCTPTLHPELFHQLIPHHPTQTMHFSFLVIITALTASMSVSACGKLHQYCLEDEDCCSGFYCDVSALYPGFNPKTDLCTLL